ncbi:hypothetical protein WICPIJ_007545 [Wickerhamomyces pijperi]|uniref:Uncharacterized protein n=1 Tax=Wickerhamomyces pijperi TaxID=599730 RepID=A0A9P8TJT4_WICPI|nr:hypothetical protein WICPIJ_007545 [Wickerhamomyces pijperi]
MLVLPFFGLNGSVLVSTKLTNSSNTTFWMILLLTWRSWLSFNWDLIFVLKFNTSLTLTSDSISALPISFNITSIAESTSSLDEMAPETALLILLPKSANTMES